MQITNSHSFTFTLSLEEALDIANFFNMNLCGLPCVSDSVIKLKDVLNTELLQIRAEQYAKQRFEEANG